MSKLVVASRLLVALFSAGLIAACSSQSPVAPDVDTGTPTALDARGDQAPPGVYDLSFHTGGTLQPVSSLSVGGDELILMAHVTNGAGAPAVRGSATFEYCSYKKLPPNDITRADEAPKEACEQGTARWARLAAIAVDAGRCPGLGLGYACMTFGVVRIPRLVGFRFRYAAQRSGIADGMSESKNFTWTP